MMMLQAGVDLESKNSKTRTPLIVAVFAGQIAVIELLVESGKFGTHSFSCILGYAGITQMKYAVDMHVDGKFLKPLSRLSK